MACDFYNEKRARNVCVEQRLKVFCFFLKTKSMWLPSYYLVLYSLPLKLINIFFLPHITVGLCLQY